jgi:hypothetical protein
MRLHRGKQPRDRKPTQIQLSLPGQSPAHQQEFPRALASNEIQDQRPLARARVWLQVECGSHRERKRGAASGSLHRLVRPNTRFGEKSHVSFGGMLRARPITVKDIWPLSTMRHAVPERLRV